VLTAVATAVRAQLRFDQIAIHPRVVLNELIAVVARCLGCTEDQDHVSRGDEIPRAARPICATGPLTAWPTVTGSVYAFRTLAVLNDRSRTASTVRIRR
jgi:hypothetical protein